MLLKPDCIPCILNMVFSAARKLTFEEDEVKKMCKRYLEVPALKGLVWDITSAEVVEIVLKQLIEATHDPDPFFPEKVEQNKKIIRLYPDLRELAYSSSNDPLSTAVTLAITGNSIDPMASRSVEGIESLIEEILKTPLPEEGCLSFKERLKKTGLLLYFCDNAGEILFDKLLAQTIREHYDTEIVFVVRSLPALNDATMKEAEQVGMTEVGTIIENGIKGPLPGTILKRCSGEVNDLVRRADLIVSKGGGNSETLDEERHLKGKTIFMLLSRCYPQYERFGVEIGRPILAEFK